MNLNAQSSNTTYLDQSTPDSRFNFNIGNLGLVFTDLKTTSEGKPVDKGWASVSFGLGFNRTNSFSSNTTAQGVNHNNSILDFYAQDANSQGLPPYALSGYPYNNNGTLGSAAYNTYLIDPMNQVDSNLVGDSTHYKGVNYKENHPGLKQTDAISTHGAMNNINFTFGANYSNKLYLGATLSLPTVAYHTTRITTETNTANNPVYYNYSQLTETLNTSGLGVTGSLGAIYRVADFLRLGASLQLPTYLSLTDDYTSSLTGSTFQRNGVNTYSSDLPAGNFHYSIITPMKETVSGAILIGHEGFISADYEFVNYGTARINTTFGNSGSGQSSTDLNQEAARNLGSVGNLRVGAEYRLDAIALRLGYQMYGSPYSSGYLNTNNIPSGYNGSTAIYSGGIGFRSNDYFLDFTYFLQKDAYANTVYTVNDVQSVSYIKSNRSNFMVTFGSRF
jgi:hypothetical protein